MTVTTLRPDHYEDNAADRVANEANYAAGETVGERDSGDVWLRTATGWKQISAAGAGRSFEIGGTVVDENGVARTVNRSLLNATAIGATEVVAAQGAGLRIRVIAAYHVSTTAVTAKFQSGGTDISPGLPVGANAGIVLPRNDHGWFQTAVNEALNFNQSAAVITGVMVDWIQAT